MTRRIGAATLAVVAGALLGGLLLAGGAWLLTPDTPHPAEAVDLEELLVDAGCHQVELGPQRDAGQVGACTLDGGHEVVVAQFADGGLRDLWAGRAAELGGHVHTAGLWAVVSWESSAGLETGVSALGRAGLG